MGPPLRCILNVYIDLKCWRYRRRLPPPSFRKAKCHLFLAKTATLLSLRDISPNRGISRNKVSGEALNRVHLSRPKFSIFNFQFSIIKRRSLTAFFVLICIFFRRCDVTMSFSFLPAWARTFCSLSRLSRSRRCSRRLSGTDLRICRVLTC